MSNTAIKVENVSKKYIIGHQQQGQSQYKSLREVISNRAKVLTRKLLHMNREISNPNREEFWALKDISVEIKQGDRVGIIGRNGAGKSTLLKILSRITEPTHGKIYIKGRIASLLEVGTGFHPELTGRENIFLNGAILGMSKIEIKRKFDEIVAFAEVEKFLDTPVKRYSSGMYVRLAFAVAAHLEPEILIVDEVLAVGDVQFQKKCLGKMEDVSNIEGRTVIFVSHNMDAIQRLCNQCLLLESGQLLMQSDTASVVQQYLSKNLYQASPNTWIDVSTVERFGTGEAKFLAVQYSSLNQAIGFKPYSNGSLEFLLKIASDETYAINSLGVSLRNHSGSVLVNADIISIGKTIKLKPGENLVRIKIDKLYLNPGIYFLGLWLDKLGTSSANDALDYIEFACEIEVVNLEYYSHEWGIQAIGPVVCNFSLIEDE
ncbi:ABC transporter-related protein [Nostoc carneum NIES-2107]|nr:ABC transporter-related protein [Nostoc carneum NIES-2107]